MLQFFYLLFPTHFPHILFACSCLMLIISCLHSYRLSMVQSSHFLGTLRTRSSKLQTWTLGLDQVWSGSRLKPQYCSVIILNIYIYLSLIFIYISLYKKVIFLFCALPNGLRQIYQLIFWNYESVDLLKFMLPLKWAKNHWFMLRIGEVIKLFRYMSCSSSLHLSATNQGK